MNRRPIVTFIGGVAATLAVILLLGAGGKVTSPTGTAPDRYVYYRSWATGTSSCSTSDPAPCPTSRP
jgi:hypothetical protein